MTEVAGLTLKQPVTVEEGTNGTGGHFAAKSFKFDIAAAAGWSDHDFSFPIPISIFAAQVLGDSAWADDEIEFNIAPETTVGALGADVAVDDTVITVDASAYANLEVGYFVQLSDGTNADDLGMVLAKGGSNQITVETAAAHAFAAATPTYVKQTVKMIPHGHLPQAARLVIGDSKIGGTLIPANTTLRLRYNNSVATAKTFQFWLEYMY